MKSKIQPFGFLIALLILGAQEIAVNAQQESVNIFKYVPQPGFRMSRLDGKTEFTFRKDKKFVIIDLMDIAPSYGNAAENSQNDWNELVLKNYVIKGEVAMESAEQDGWQVTARTAVSSIIKFNISLITFTCSSGHASVLLVNNDFSNILDKEIGEFIGSLSLVDPASAMAMINPVMSNPDPGNAGSYQMPGMNTTADPGAYTMPGMNNPPDPVTNAENPTADATFQPPYTMPATESYTIPGNPGPIYSPFPTPMEQPVVGSIMMDEGWFVEATNDYIQYTKSDIKVIEYFLYDTPYPDKDQYWQQFLSQYFAADQYFIPENTGPSYFSVEFAWGYAAYKPNGQNYFVAWLVDYNVPAAFVAITSNESIFRQYFPEGKNLGEMQRFNNFPVSLDAIQGEWTESNFAGAQMYEVNTGNYAGMSMASAASSYSFSGNNFIFSSKGATGMVGTANVFQVKESGNFNVDRYLLVTNVSSRTDEMTNSTIPMQETREYSVAFRYARNVKVLFMQNKKYSGMTYNLVRIQ